MKKFNFFEKLWEHGRTLRRVGLVLVMCLIAIPQLWAMTGYYEEGGKAIQLCFYRNGADAWQDVASSQGSAGDLGTVSSLYLKKFYVYAWRENQDISWVDLHWKIYKESDGTTDGNGWTDSQGYWIENMNPAKNAKFGCNTDANINCLDGLEPGETYIFAYCINGDNLGWLNNGGWYAQRFTYAAEKVTFTPGQYIYLDARNQSNWQSADFSAHFWFKRYDTSADVDDESCVKNNLLGEEWVYYAVVPEGDYTGKLQVNRDNPSTNTAWCNGSVMTASDRSSKYPNCLGGSGSDCGWTPSWTTYCPPKATSSISDNGTVTYGGNGGSSTPYLVEKGGTIKVQASSTNILEDGNMTTKYHFYDNTTSKSGEQSGSTYQFTASSSANVTYQMRVNSYNQYNSTNSSDKYSDRKYYKTVTCYTVTYNANGGTGSVPAVSGSKYMSGTDVTLATNTGGLAKSGYKLVGWNTATDGSGTHYELGATLASISADQLLYAEWLQVHTPSQFSYTSDYGKTPAKVSCDLYEWYSISKLSAGSFMIMAGEQTKTGTGSEGNIVIALPGTSTYNHTNWFTINYQGSGTTTVVRSAEFSDLLSGSNAPEIKLKYTYEALKIAVSGYSEFSFVAKDNDADKSKNKYIKVVINGTDVTGSTTSGDWSIRRFDLTSFTPPYLIELQGTGGSTASELTAFSLKLADDYPVPTSLASSDITSSGVTLTVTDSWSTGDYEFYVDENSTKPAANATPSESTHDAYSVDITGLDASTTYYAWVRSVCSNTRKSDWVALTGSYFTTEAAASTYSITYECYSATSGCPATNPATGQTALPDPLPTVTKNGYTFDGWYYDDEFESEASAGDALSGNVTLYAKWDCTTPTITGPSHATVCKDASSPELSVSADANGGTLSYQWYSNDENNYTSPVALENCTTATYSAASTSSVGTVYYYCVVTNTTGSCSANSDIAAVTVTAPTAISSHPSNVTNGVVGSPSTLTVTATGTGTLTYQWYTCKSDGSSASAIGVEDNATADDATLSITPSTAGTTYYKCVVHSDCGSDQTSSVASITAKNNITPTLTYASTVAVGATINPSLSGNTGSGSVSYALNDVTPDGSLTINTSTGAVTGVTAGGTATVTVTISATEYYWGKTATSGTITVPYNITHSDASNGTYTIKVGDADAVSTSTTALSSQTVALAATPSSGYVINAWNVTGATVGNNHIASTSFTMPAGNVTVAPTFKLMPNVYYYQDATRYASSTYKAPDGNTASSGDDQTINSGNEWTISSSITGLTVKAKGCKYDGKGSYMDAYLKVLTGGDASDKYVKFVIDAGYKATSLKIKIGGYSSNPTVTLKPYVSSLGDAIAYTGTVGGVATTENNFNEISWSNLAAGTYYLNVTSQNAYISEITAQVESLGYAVAEGTHTGGTITIKDDEDNDLEYAKEGETVYLSASASTGYNFTSWTIKKTEDGSDVTAYVSLSGTTSATFTMPAYGVTVDATFTPIEYRISVKSANHARYTVQVDEGAASEFSTYAHIGQTITLNAGTITSGYYLKTWGVTETESGDEIAVAVTNPASFTMPACGVTVKPYFGKKFTVSFDANCEDTDPDPVTQSAVGGTVTLADAPTNLGYTFVGWVIGSETYAAGYTSYVPTADVTAIAAWKENCAGGGGSGKSVRFTTSNKNDAGEYFADFSSTSQMVGTGSAKLIAIGDAKINAANKKDGYRSDSRMEMVFKFASSSTLDVYVTTGSTSRTYALYSFSSAKELSAIEAADYSSNTIVSSNVTATGATFANTTVQGTPSVSSGVITISGTAGGVKISYTNLSGYYVFKALGSSESYIYGFDINGGSATCYYVTYNGNGATGGLVNDQNAYSSGATVTVLGNTGGFTRPGYEFTGWNTKTDGTGTARAKDATFTISGNTMLYAQWNPLTLTFNGRGVDWTDPANWTDANSVTPACVPTIEHNVIIDNHKVILYGPYADDDKGHGMAKKIEFDKSSDGHQNDRIEIWSEGSLIVAEDIQVKHQGDGGYVHSTPDDIEIQTSILGNGGLICGKASDNTEATYVFRTKAFMVKVEGKKYYRNQYFGIPFESINANQYWGSVLYEYDDANDAWKAPTPVEDVVTLQDFTAYNLVRRVEAGEDFTLTGTLNLPGTSGTKTLYCGWRDASDEKWTTVDFPASIDGEEGHQDFMFANSWTAPISIKDLQAADCSNLVQAIYIFNTGYEVGGVKQIGDDDGQWSSFPFNSSSYMEDAVIPATQAFAVTATAEDATLTLDYGKHVYTPAVDAGQINNFATRAPKRDRAAEDAPVRLKLMVYNDSLRLDKLYLFERPDFTNAFDNGWDGTKIEGVNTVPELYAIQGNKKMAVDAVPEFDGVEIGFRAGTKLNEYTFVFDYEETADPLYLYDRETEEFTLIQDKGTYMFTTEDKAEHARFVLTRSKSPQIVTGVVEVQEPTEKVQDTKVRKVLINNHIYIIRGNRVYGIDGSLVK